MDRNTIGDTINTNVTAFYLSDYNNMFGFFLENLSKLIMSSKEVCVSRLCWLASFENSECMVFMRLAHRLQAALPHFYEDR